MQKVALMAFYHDIRDGDMVPAYINQNNTKNNELSISSSDEAIKIFKNEVKRIQDAYVLRHGKPPRKFQAKQSLLQELVLSIDKNVTMDQIKKCGEWLEKSYGFKILLLAIHKDEGEDVEDGKINYHAHIILLNLDKNCKSIRRKLKIRDMKAIQTKMAQICNMPRGKDYAKDLGGPAKKYTTHLSGRHFAVMANSIKNAQPGSVLESIIKNSQIYQNLAKYYPGFVDVFIAVQVLASENEMLLQEKCTRYLDQGDTQIDDQEHPLATNIKDIVVFLKQDVEKFRQLCKIKNSEISDLKFTLKNKNLEISELKSKISQIQNLAIDANIDTGQEHNTQDLNQAASMSFQNDF